MKTSCAIVVTFNRLELLKLTIEKLSNQTVKLNEILIINNASTDGTTEYLSTLNKQNVTVINLPKNVGGAGGFHEGIKTAYNKNHEYMWIMDDDTIAEENAFEELLNGLEVLKGRNVGFVCSNVLYKDGSACIMNTPKVFPIWNDYASKGAVRLFATSFVSMLVTRDIVAGVGLPIKEFFIWGDDAEFTKRINKNHEGYMITSSVVYHYMNENRGVHIIDESANRVDRYFYEYRNKFFIARTEGIKSFMEYLEYFFRTLALIVVRKNESKLKKIKIVAKGFIKGITFKPKIEKV